MSLSTSDPQFIQHWVTLRGGSPAVDEKTAWPTISFQNKPGKNAIDWPEFFRLMKQHQLSFVYDPAPDARTFSLVRDSGPADDEEAGFSVVKNKRDPEEAPGPGYPDDEILP